MRTVCLTILLHIVASASLSAQPKDSVLSKSKFAGLDTFKRPVNKVDTISRKIQNTTTDINKKITQFENFRPSVPNYPKLDSLQTGSREKIAKAKKLQAKALKNLQKINPKNKLAKYNHRIDSTQRSMISRIDGLAKLQIPDPVKKSLDSLRGKLDSIKYSRPVRSVRKAEKRLASLQTGVNSKLTGVEGKVNAKLKLFNQNGGNAGSINSGLAGKMKVPALNGKLPGINTNLPGFNFKSNLNTSGLSGKELIPTSGINLQGTTLNAGQPKLGGLPGFSMPSFLPKNELAGLTNIQKEADQFSKATGELTKYEKDIQNVTKGEVGSLQKLQKDMEGKVAGMSQVKQLQTESMTVEQYKKMEEKWNSDPEYRKELAVNKAKEQTLNYFAGHQKELNAAMGQLSKAKTKLKDAEEVADLFGKRTNPMKGKPFAERLRPGINIQVQMKQIVLLDFNPQLGYRFNGRLMAGLGWNERIGFNSTKYTFSANDRVFGPRSFAQFRIKNSYYAMVNAEIMNAYIPETLLSSKDAGTRAWVPGIMTGFKKEFRYSNKVLGNVQVLYNIYDPHHESPYVDRLNIRMGFEFPMMKRKAVGR